MTTALIVVACVLFVGLAWWRLAVAARRLDRILAEEKRRADTPTDPETTTQP